MLGWFLRAIIWRKCSFGEENIEESHQKIQYILQNIQKKTILFRKLPIYNKKPIFLRKGIGFCQQSEIGRFVLFFLYIKILVSEQGNAVCEKTVELSQFVDYEERQKGLS